MEYTAPVSIKIPRQRVAVLIGKNGEIKKRIEQLFKIRLDITSFGDVTITANDSLAALQAKDVVLAIARGFSPENAMLLYSEENMLDVINLTDFIGKREKALERLKSRLIGARGKARFNIEESTKTKISIYGKTVSIIGPHEGVALARQAIEKLISGRQHKAVYNFLNSKKS